LTVVPGVGRAFLTWNENKERDLAGYHVYRSTKSGRDYERLTDMVLSRTTFSDETAKPGAVYYYRITAVDRSGNESTESEEKKAAIEKLPGHTQRGKTQ
jgi:fibronectin type 3 domain-containing protein